MPDIFNKPDELQSFHDHFKIITENMLQSLVEIRNAMEQVHAFWNDPGYDRLKAILDDTTCHSNIPSLNYQRQILSELNRFKDLQEFLLSRKLISDNIINWDLYKIELGK